jgi:hypothetical protein
MRITDDEFRAAVRAFFDALPAERLRDLALKFLADPFTNSQRQPGRPGRPRKAVEEGNVVPLHRKPGRRRRKPAVDEAKLAKRRKRYAANRKAARHAAKAARAIKSAGNGEDVAVTPAMLWQRAERIEPTAPWKALGVRDIHAQAAYRNQSLPPHVGAMAITKFLTLPVAN